MRPRTEIAGGRGGPPSRAWRGPFSGVARGGARGRRFALAVALAAAATLAAPACALDLEPDENEESAGASFHVQANPSDRVYGLGFGGGLWLRGTPVFGDYFLSLISNGIEDAFYSGVGMTIRIMPHWRTAPFVGGGGSYNYAFSTNHTHAASSSTGSTGSARSRLEGRGESYGAGHVEAGLRFWFEAPLRMVEVLGRYTWSFRPGDRDYWLVGLSIGTRL
jgi:hypothetical protein